MAGATLTLLFGHVLLTASLDLVVWPAAMLFAIRAVLRDDGRWWLAAGAVIGASTFNKLLVVILMIGIALGLAICGPRRWFASGWLWAGVGLAALLAAPNAIYQATHGWPQLAMGAALSTNNAEEVRIMMWPFLILLVGPVLAVFWVLALVGLFRRPEWRAPPLRRGHLRGRRAVRVRRGDAVLLHGRRPGGARRRSDRCPWRSGHAPAVAVSRWACCSG